MEKYTDQQFFYKQTPVNYDGIAKFTSIKGNTLGWNQIFIPQYRSNSGIQVGSIQDGNDYSVRIWGTATANAWLRMDATGTLPVGHKFLLDKGSTSDLFDINNDNNGLLVDFSAKTKIGTITTADKYIYIFVGSGTTIDVTVKPILIDLTKMFGSGNEPSTVEDFTSLFPLSYYSYNQGSLLSFNGNGIKTVGFNQWDEEWETGGINGSNGGTYSDSTRIRSKNYISVFPNMVYYIKAPKAFNYSWYDENKQYISGDNSATPNYPRTSPNGARYLKFSTTGTTYNNDICINISDTERNGEYEPYTSSTLSLPISTYFPSGMKSAGNVYDELTESKAITRIGMVDLGSLTWNYTGGRFQTSKSSISPQPSATSSVICSQYPYSASAEVDKTITQSASYFRIYDSSYTDAQTFKTAMSGVYLYYELATPIETSFTTASLVTENAEIPLSNNDGTLIGKCTEELSAEPGFHDAKIKLSDSDGECYSNKLQLHVERSPQ